MISITLTKEDRELLDFALSMAESNLTMSADVLLEPPIIEDSGEEKNQRINVGHKFATKARRAHELRRWLAAAQNIIIEENT